MTAIENRISDYLAYRLGKWFFMVQCSQTIWDLQMVLGMYCNSQEGECRVVVVEQGLFEGTAVGAPVMRIELETILQSTLKELSETAKQY